MRNLREARLTLAAVEAAILAAAPPGDPKRAAALKASVVAVLPIGEDGTISAAEFRECWRGRVLPLLDAGPQPSRAADDPEADEMVVALCTSLDALDRSRRLPELVSEQMVVARTSLGLDERADAIVPRAQQRALLERVLERSLGAALAEVGEPLLGLLDAEVEAEGAEGTEGAHHAAAHHAHHYGHHHYGHPHYGQHHDGHHYDEAPEALATQATVVATAEKLLQRMMRGVALQAERAALGLPPRAADALGGARAARRDAAAREASRLEALLAERDAALEASRREAAEREAIVAQQLARIGELEATQRAAETDAARAKAQLEQRATDVQTLRAQLDRTMRERAREASPAASAPATTEQAGLFDKAPASSSTSSAAAGMLLPAPPTSERPSRVCDVRVLKEDGRFTVKLHAAARPGAAPAQGVGAAPVGGAAASSPPRACGVHVVEEESRFVVQMTPSREQTTADAAASERHRYHAKISFASGVAQVKLEKGAHPSLSSARGLR